MRRDEVIMAIHRQGPSYVPIYFFNRDQDQSDIVALEVQRHFLGSEQDRSEWGFTWSRLDETMGHPRTILIQSWDDLTDLSVPDVSDPGRFSGVDEFNQCYPDRFRLASLALSGFTTMSFLRGFNDLMVDIALAPERVGDLADIVFGFEERLIAELPQYHFDAVAFFDDWGTQQGMIISPSSWRSIFKPRYARQFALAHSLGLYVYFHCCGFYLDIIPDLIEIGVDLLNVSQPNLYDIPELGCRFGGQVCFVCPVSYQTTSITGTPEQIFEDVRILVENLGCFNGGLVGYVEEYHSVGMSEENYQACVQAFRVLGRYQQRGPESGVGR